MAARRKNTSLTRVVDPVDNLVLTPTETTALLPSDNLPSPGYPKAHPTKSYPTSGGYGKSTSGYGSRIVFNYGEKPIIDLGNGRKLNTATWWGRRRFFIIKYINLIQGLLWIMGMMATFLTILILFKIWDGQIYVRDSWELDTDAFFYDFEEISISSPSETCNEYLRMVVQEEHLPFVGLPLFMQACLSIAEPHASGPGGDTVLVYSKPADDICQQVHGSDQFYHDFEDNELGELFLQRMRANSIAHFMGEAGIRLPGHLIGQIGMYELMQEKMEPAELDEAIRKTTYVFRKEFVEDNLHFPVTPRLYEILTYAVAFSTRESGAIRHLYGNYNEPSPVGTLFPVQKEQLLDFFAIFSSRDQFIDFKTKIITDFDHIYGEYATVLDSTHSILLLKHFAARAKELLKNTTRIVEKGQVTQLEKKKGKKTICSPSGLKFRDHHISNSAYPVVPEMIKAYKERLRYAVPGYDAIASIDTYLRIIWSYAKVMPFIRRMSETVHNLSGDLTRDLEEQYRSEAEAMKTVPIIQARQFLVGNGFVIVNHRRGEAFAVSSTLGDPFGSMTGFGLLLFNNLNSDYGKDPQFGAYKNLQEPMIISSGREIEIAYAGPPGYSSYSLDVPRKMTSLVLTLFHGWNLEAALSTPIVSYYRDAFVEYLGFPYSITHNIASYFRPFSVKDRDGKELLNVDINKATDLSKEKPLTDEVAAVHGRRAIFYGMDRQRQPVLIMPSGF